MAIDYDAPETVDVNSRSNHAHLPKESPPDRTQLAGDVVPLPINPFQGSDHSSSKETAASYSVGSNRGSDPKVISIGNNAINNFISNARRQGRLKE